MSNMFFEYIYVSFKMVKTNMWAVTCDWLWVNWCHTCFLLINKSISHSETMMLWSDNITRASGEICLVNVRFAACPLSFDWKQKKNLLTFSATTNACLKKEEKKKKKSENEGGWILSVVFSFFFFFFWTVDNQISKNPAGDDPAELWLVPESVWLTIFHLSLCVFPHF